MKKTELTSSSVVMTKNGKIGIVVSFNGNPSHIVFASFTNPIGSWSDDLTHAYDDYSIAEVRDGSTIENVLDVFKKKVYTTLKVVG